MSEHPREPQKLSPEETAVRRHIRQRRQSLAGIVDLNRTHRIFGGTSMPVASIAAATFPTRGGWVTFQTVIRILSNSGVHKGLIFEYSISAGGVAAWVEDNKIGFHAGDDGTVDGATALFDLGSELPPTLEIDLVFSVSPGDGKVRIWANGNELARGSSSGGDFGTSGLWAPSAPGSFVSLPSGSVVTDVPASSRIAPNGFEAIEALSVYMNQKPIHFV